MLSLSELAVYVGVNCATVKNWSAMGLPLLSKRILLEDFILWRQRHLGLLDPVAPTPAAKRSLDIKQILSGISQSPRPPRARDNPGRRYGAQGPRNR